MTNPASNFAISSPAFKEGDLINIKYSGYGSNISPPLKWTGAPKNTKSFALIMHDPDAPLIGGFSHWVIWNIPPNAKELKEGIPSNAIQLPDGSCQGVNGIRQTGYMGPKPSSGSHRYFFYLYALDAVADLDSKSNIESLIMFIFFHNLGQCQLMGKFIKP